MGDEKRMSTECPLTVTRPNIDATGHLADEDAEGQKFDLNRDETFFFPDQTLCVS